MSHTIPVMMPLHPLTAAFIIILQKQNKAIDDTILSHRQSFAAYALFTLPMPGHSVQT